MQKKKHILVVSQYFYPEQFRINDICQEWVKRGYQVTVVTGIPNYPEGRFYTGYGFFKRRTEKWNGVRIIRIPLIARGKTPVGMVVNYLSFVISSFLWVRFTKIKADYVFTFEVSPMTQALLGVWYSKKHKIPNYLYVQDLWPENVEIVTGIHSQLILKPIGKMVDYIYKNCDQIFATSPSFVKEICKRGAEAEKVHYWPQYAEEYYKPVKKSCIFEHIYFARNDATIDNVNAYDFRVKCGEVLAKDEDIKADIVVPVPDSGWAGAVGYSNESKLPLSEGLVKNRYVGRTFIKPIQEEREIGVKIKLNPLSNVVKGKSIVLVDDSVVRGTTSKLIVKSLRDAGASEIHLRITSPPVQYSCYYGIDTPHRSNLIASGNDVEYIREYIGCDSLKFLDIDLMIEATENKATFCKACFDGDYPVKKLDREELLSC